MIRIIIKISWLDIYVCNDICLIFFSMVLGIEHLQSFRNCLASPWRCSCSAVTTANQMSGW